MAEDSPPIAGSDLRDLAQEIALRVIAMLGCQASGEAARPVPPDDNLVFVISSFTPEMEPSYLAITSAAQAAGLRAERVKDVPGDYRITDRILKMIGQARLVVADLTNERPNVYFELGYARGLGKTVITILRTGTNIHFDVRDWTYIEYFDSRPLENDLLQRFNFELQRSLHPSCATGSSADSRSAFPATTTAMSRAASAPINHVTHVTHYACPGRTPCSD